jgi:hypothetical protein
MYQDQESIRAFERIHARDHLAELARHVGDDRSDDTDVFAGHARAERCNGIASTVLAIASAVTLVSVAVWVLH